METREVVEEWLDERIDLDAAVKECTIRIGKTKHEFVKDTWRNMKAVAIQSVQTHNAYIQVRE